MTHWYYDTFNDLLVEIEQGLHTYLNQFPRRTPLFWTMVNHHFGWADLAEGSDSSRLNPSGKRIRPLLTLLVAQAVTGRHDHAVSGALAVEIIHNFTLIHDDVMDKSFERRHRPTLWAKWGSAQAINTGDGLFALGMEAALDLVNKQIEPMRALDAARLLLATCVATVEGQMLDVSFEERLDVSPDEYLTMIALKSGALIECSTRMGAALSTDDVRVIDAYAAFGRNLGTAFQIWDDYLGIWGAAEMMGKSATSDIEGKKKSYPVLIAFERASEADRRTLEMVYRKKTVEPEDVEVVLRILEAVQAADQTRAMIESYYGQALAALESVASSNEAHKRLRGLAEFLIVRAY